MTTTFEPYGPDHAAAAHALWVAALGSTWPLEPAAFNGIARHGLVAIEQGRLVGVALTDRPPQLATSLTLLVVDPAARRRGVGTALLNAAIDLIRQGGSRAIQLGGGYSYFWPGIPTDLPGARGFFERRGWESTEVSWDLVAELSGSQSAVDVEQRTLPTGLTIRPAVRDDYPKVIAFEEEHFPQWVDFYRSALQPNRLVIAVDAREHVVGALILSYPGDGHTLWAPLVGAGTGGIGAVGVAPRVRNLGVGTALVARACEILHEAGADRCHAGWTNLLTFYGRLAFRPWREYDMAWRTV